MTVQAVESREYILTLMNLFLLRTSIVTLKMHERIADVSDNTFENFSQIDNNITFSMSVSEPVSESWTLEFAVEHMRG